MATKCSDSELDPFAIVRITAKNLLGKKFKKIN